MKVPRAIRAIGGGIVKDVELMRFELRRIRGMRARGPVIRRYLQSHEIRCLHIGAGGNVLPGWLNTDLEPQTPEIVYLDVSDPLPFPDNTLDFVFTEHLIEHLPHELAAYHLRECCRALKPDGRVRVSTPDLQFLIDIYTRSDHTETQARYVRRILQNAYPNTGFYDGAFVLNHFVKYWGHQFIYDEKTLPDAIRRAGFRSARRWGVGESDAPMLQNVEHHGDAISDEFNRMQSIIFEGTK
jgi:predicted SAM-dependent methyltransferase